jgi:hypothetical protein
MMRTIATGWWCETCEFFEDEDQVDLTNEVQCTGCGCPPGAHVPVEVVTKGLV